MAKAKDGGAEQSATEKAKDGKAIQLITERQLKKLLKNAEDMKEAVDGLVGSHREEVKNAIEKQHLHKGAFADVKRLSKIKSNEALAMHWDTLLAYMEMSGLMKRIESVQSLPLDDDKADEAAGEGGDQEGDAGSKVTRPQFGGNRRSAPVAAE